MDNDIDLQTAIRTSAILYSEEIGTTKTNTILRKIIESYFLTNNNQDITIEELILGVKKTYKLNYEEDELIRIINNSDSFECDSLKKTVSLTKARLVKLNSQNFDFDVLISDFLKCYPKYKEIDSLNIVQKYLYELLNTNFDAYSSIINTKKNSRSLYAVDSKNFKDIEIQLINDFLVWENKEKNELIFKLISFCIEYSLVSNNSESKVYYDSLKNKIFYLDANIIFRAVGINGDFRKQRTLYFLNKCKQSGQRFLVSKFTVDEIKRSLNAHINELSSLSYGRINSELFRISNSGNDFYEYYHIWRKNRISKSLEVFRAYVLSEIDNLYSQFGIMVNYKLMVKESDQKILKKLTQYEKEIFELKKYTGENVSKTDARNMLAIETERKNNNVAFQDTKYYLLTTDQKLKAWDKKHSSHQPLALLPSQWMGLLLKFVSRTDDDYQSFLNFLKLPGNEPTLKPDELENVIAAISEMTEDFQM